MTSGAASEVPAYSLARMSATLVEPLPVAAEQRVVDRLADDHVLEARALRPLRIGLVEHPLPGEQPDHLPDRRVRSLRRDPRQQGDRELAPEHRGGLHDRRRVRPAAEPDWTTSCSGAGTPLTGSASAAASASHWSAGVEDAARHLLEHQRHALALIHDPAHAAPRRARPARHGLHELQGQRRRQRLERDRREAARSSGGAS